MEPLHPDLRTALKRAHPGLTDAIIDRYEELTAQQFILNPSLHAERFATLDRERQNILREHMPRYNEVLQQFEKHHKHN